jgi:hypothetical protein
LNAPSCLPVRATALRVSGVCSTVDSIKGLTGLLNKACPFPSDAPLSHDASLPPDSSLPHDVPHASNRHSSYPKLCGQCVHHRCSLWGMNKCGAWLGYTAPQGWQLEQCMCGCCRMQCGLPPHCSAGLSRHTSSKLIADEVAVSVGTARLSPQRGAGGRGTMLALASVAIFAAVAMGVVRRSSRGLARAGTAPPAQVASRGRIQTVPCASHSSPASAASDSEVLPHSWNSCSTE